TSARMRPPIPPPRPWKKNITPAACEGAGPSIHVASGFERGRTHWRWTISPIAHATIAASSTRRRRTRLDARGSGLTHGRVPRVSVPKSPHRCHPVGRRRAIMGLFSTHWRGEFEGHTIEVVRRWGGHEFELQIDGKTVASAASLVNMGERKLEGTLEHDGRTLPVHAVGTQGAFTEGAAVVVGDRPIEMKKVS